jgi:hypothetical protein
MSTTHAPASDVAWQLPSRPSVAIFVVSVLALFLEMLIIRWIGTEIRIFAYLQNTLLIACFLGLGMGFFTCRRPLALSETLIPLGFLLLLVAVPFTRGGLTNLSQSLSLLGDLVIWARSGTTGPWVAATLVSLGLVTVYFLLVLIVDVFVPLGRLLGRLLDDHPDPIHAYSANVAGSLAGTWLFVALSAFYQPPVTWFLIVAALIVGVTAYAPRQRTLVIALALVLVPVAWYGQQVPGAVKVVWSPYQKLVLKPPDRALGEIGDYVITVNNTGYQMIEDLSEAHTPKSGEGYPPEFRGLSQYDLPLLFHPNPQRYLVVGAGAGNDVAGGLRHGVTSIVAVEIDPAIIAMGRAFHPEQPYASPAVRVVNDDARSYFATTNERFDVITFGLLDSHTTTAMTNARLDSYVYTRESLARAKALLAPGGVIVLSFEAQKPFIADRMAEVLRDEFGEPPIAFRVPPSAYGWGGVLFVAGDLAAARHQMATNPRLGGFVEAMTKAHPMDFPYAAKVTTDDWPYTYLEFARIPVLYYLLAVLMALVWWRTARRCQAPAFFRGWTRMHWHFFLLGAAFLLLEVQNVSKASVVLGNTWEVNAVVVSSVLAMALAANWAVRRFQGASVGLIYAVLLAVCVALYFLDLARFGFLPYATKAVVVGGLTTCPIFFSGMIFTRSFVAAPSKQEAFGANLVGAIGGALLQSLTFVVGVKALLIVVAALYAASWVALPAPVGAPARAPATPAVGPA